MQTSLLIKCFHIFFLQVTGEANEEQILSSLEVYSKRAKYISVALRKLFMLATHRNCNQTERCLKVKYLRSCRKSMMKEFCKNGGQLFQDFTLEKECLKTIKFSRKCKLSFFGNASTTGHILKYEQNCYRNKCERGYFYGNCRTQVENYKRREFHCRYVSWNLEFFKLISFKEQ